MKIKLFIFSLLLSSCIGLSAQDTARVVDRVFTADNKIYVGQISDDKKGDSLIITVYHSGIYSINYNQIKRIQYRVDNPNYVEKPEKPVVRPENPDKHAERVVVKSDQPYEDLVAFNGYRATPRVTDKLVKKRNIGIGLTVGGVCLVGLGAVVFSVSPKQSTASSGGVLFSTPSPGSIVGILMIAAGVGITIPGVAIWGSYAHRLHKAEMEN